MGALVSVEALSLSLFVFVLFILGGKFYESKEIDLFTSLILGLIVDEC